MRTVITAQLNTALLPLLLACLCTLLALNPLWAFKKENEQLFRVDEAQQELRILSSTDINYFAPIIKAYQSLNPDTNVLYTLASSTEVFNAINNEQATYDLAISSAMDLQIKLVNDGMGQPYESSITSNLPSWAKWQSTLFAFTQEPAVLIASKKGLQGLSIPSNRQELITLLRDNPEHFKGKIGTYDLRISGAGYLFATQDTRQSDAFWRLAEVMGSLAPRLYCCSSDMISDLSSGKIILAYNIIGSYASKALASNPDGMVLPLSDYTHFLLRTAFIPSRSPNPELAGSFIDFLLSADGRQLIKQKAGLPPIDGEALAKDLHFRPIRLGPELLVYLDKIKHRQFIDEWIDAMVQP